MVKSDLRENASHLRDLTNFRNFPKASQNSQELHVLQRAVMGLCLSRERERVPRKFNVILYRWFLKRGAQAGGDHYVSLRYTTYAYIPQPN